ncbi:hypothetical protein [Salinimonas chungwhensis]|uniref:hypothetical protein n=1 Tax=Salinimonas chungwhensis TaxID=265425 RepID=UPI000372B40E|nr:hypothetical protein [Salinimonas chungwhensis]
MGSENLKGSSDSNDMKSALSSLISLMAAVYCHENDITLYARGNDLGYSPDFFKGESEDWARKYLVGIAFEALTVKASEHLCRWVKDVFDCAVIVGWAEYSLKRKYAELHR